MEVKNFPESIWSAAQRYCKKEGPSATVDLLMFIWLCAEDDKTLSKVMAKARREELARTR